MKSNPYNSASTKEGEKGVGGTTCAPNKWSLDSLQYTLAPSLVSRKSYAKYDSISANLIFPNFRVHSLVKED